MKKTLLLFISICILHLIAAAQVKVVKTVRNVEIGEKAIVKDSSGRQVPYAIWTKLLASGNYVLTSNKPASDSTEYKLVKAGATARYNRQTASPQPAVDNPGPVAIPKAIDQDELWRNMPKPAESIFFTTGEKITSFSAKAIDGYKVKLKDLAGKVVVLNFWFIGCPPCREEIPELNQIARDYANNPDVVFVAIGLDDKADIKQFLKDRAFGYHIIEDGRMYADLYRLNLYPTNVVLDREGKVRFHGSGYAQNTPFWIRKTIDDAVAGH